MEKHRSANEKDMKFGYQTSSSMQTQSQNKFKPLKMQYNELQSKYDIYKNGTPNIYEKQLDALKIHHIKNDLTIMQLPSIDYVLKQLKNTPQEISANKRDYMIHPSMTHKYKNKFRDLTSDQQEVKDFMNWFKQKDREINAKDIPLNKKFHLFQNLIASGFSQILNQITIISKPRAQILKMLWNRQTSQAQNIINMIHQDSTKKQKKNLQIIKSLHIGYQEQIINLKSQTYCMQKKLEETLLLNQSCINTLRVMRKQSKKTSIILKQFQNTNLALKEESLNLIEENTKLLMKDKNITPEHARILTYRLMQGQNYRKKMKDVPKMKQIIKDIKNKAEQSVENYDLPDIDDRKQRLLSFIKMRAKQNPQEKLFIMKGQFEDEEDEIVTLDSKIQELFQSKQIQTELSSKSINKRQEYFQQKGINTQNQKAADKKQTVEVEIQTQSVKQNNVTSLFRVSQNQEQKNYEKISQINEKKRNSLLYMQMNKTIEFKKNDSAAKMRRISKLHSTNQRNTSSIHRQNSQQQLIKKSLHSKMEQFQIESDSESQKDQSKENHNFVEIITKNHRQSFLIRKSLNFENILMQIHGDIHQVKNIEEEKNNYEDSFVSDRFQRSSAPANSQISSISRDHVKQFRAHIKKFMTHAESKQKIGLKNSERHLKKILTNTYKAIYVSGKYNFLGELIKVAKNCYGNLAYEGRLLQLINILLQTRQQNSLLSAVTLMLKVEGFEGQYNQINSQQICEIYFKIYFNLSLKNPNQTKFNLWNNYTNLNRLNSPSFMKILRQYFSENKCAYINLKIKQFIGIDSNQESKIDGNYYVQMNSLMMFLIEVYLIQKRNYYQSYHSLVDFLAVDKQLNLESFIFLLDLLCFSQQEQQKLIITLSQARKSKQKSPLFPKEKQSHKTFYEQSQQNLYICHKDYFYCLCVQYQLPLYQFMIILKNDQFNLLPNNIKKRFSEFTDKQKWKQSKQQLEIKLQEKSEITNISFFSEILNKLDVCIMEDDMIERDVFSFLYRLVVQTAFS